MLQLFKYENYGSIRIVELDNDYWFVAKDLSELLEYSGTGKMLQLIDDEDKREINPQLFPEIAQSLPDNSFRLSIINESGLYAAIFNSTKPEAKKFKKWVTSEVLPTLRKTGHFSISPVNDMSKILTFIEEQTNINRRLLEDSNQLKQFTRKGISNPGCFNILNSDNDLTEQAVTAQQYLVSKGMGSWTKRHTFSKRAASALRVGKHLESLPMYKNNVLYYGEDVAYLEETLAQMLDLN